MSQDTLLRGTGRKEVRYVADVCVIYIIMAGIIDPSLHQKE